MRRTISALVIALVSMLALPVSDARAQYYVDKGQLAKTRPIRVTFDDQVKNGCLPRPGVLKTEAELILQRSGFQVGGDTWDHILALSALGNELGDTGACVVLLDMTMARYELLSDETVGLVLSFSQTSLVWGPKAGLQEQVRNQVNELATALANEILKARANASSKSQ